MYCRKCGKEISIDSEFCKYCGTNVYIAKQETAQIVSTEESASETNDNYIINDKKNSTINPNKTNKNKYGAILLLIIIIISLFVSVLMKKTPTEKVAAMSSSVFLLHVYDKNHDLILTGSGFLAFDDMTIVTNYHVIEDAYFLEAVSEDNKIYEVSVVANYDFDKDIAILKLSMPTGLKTLDLDYNYNPKKGDEIITIGSPLGVKNTVSDGIISAISQESDRGYIQFTAPISSGSSGGALFNNKGKVIGITTASYLSGQNVNLAIPIRHVVTLEETSNENIPINEIRNSKYGTTIDNSGTVKSVVAYKGYYYHNYNDDGTIIKIDMKTGESNHLNINGSFVNVYNNNIYYVNKGIFSSDLEGENSVNIASNTFNELNGNKYYFNLFVNRSGVFFEFINASEEKDIIHNVYVLNHDGTLKKIIDGLSITGTVEYTEDGIIIFDNNTFNFYDYDNLNIYYSFNLSDYNIFSLILDFQYSDDSIILKADNSIYKFRLNDSKLIKLYEYNSEDDDKILRVSNVYNNYIYFHIYEYIFTPNSNKLPIYDGETYRIDLNGYNFKKISDYIMQDMNFINDKIYYYVDSTSSTNYCTIDLKGENVIELK